MLRSPRAAVVRLCGPLVLEIDGRRLEGALPSRQGRMVFAYLVLARPRAVARGELIDAVWPGRAPVAVEALLTALLSRLRTALPAGVLEGRGQLSLRLGAESWIDVESAATAPAQAAEALAAGDPARAVSLARSALAILELPLLPDVDRQWVEARRRELADIKWALFEVVVRAGLAVGGGELVAAERAARRMIDDEPFRESAHGLLMEVLQARGDVAQALRVYDDLRTLLRDELGTVPSAHIRELSGQLLRGGAGVASAPSLTRRGVPLPARPARLLGREQDVLAVERLLSRAGVQLVNLTGAGGIGKTSLAIEIAHRVAADFADGSVFVDLAPLLEPAAVPDAMLQALGCIREPGASALETLRLALAGGKQLVVLDNLEHLLAAASQLAELVAAAPGLKLLVTSRASLGLQAEHRYSLEPLAVPDAHANLAAVAAAPATALFIARAGARDARFRLTARNAAAIRAICARLDGLPLGIELAAARTSTLSPQEIGARLDRLLPALGSGARDGPARHRTLRATLDWSYALLDEPERALLAQLAVFAGGCSLDAAEWVTGASLDVIEGLIGQSMLSRRPGVDGETRLVMLEPIRQYAAERLSERPDREAVDECHGRYYTLLAEAARGELIGAHQRSWGQRLDLEHDNLRRALARDQRAGNAERVLRLATALEFWWLDRVLWSEGRRWIEDALATATPDLPIRPRAEGLRVSARLYARQVDLQPAHDRAREALRLHRALTEPASVSQCLAMLAVVHHMRREHEAAHEAALEAVDLGRRADPWTLAMALGAQATIARDLVAARESTDEAAALFEQRGDARSLAWLWRNLGSAALAAGELETASQLFQRALEQSRKIDDRIESVLSLANYAIVAVERQQDATAVAAIREVLASCRAYGLRRPARRALVGLAVVATRGGDAERAAGLLGAASAVAFGQPLPRVEQRLLSAATELAGSHDADPAWGLAHAAGQRLSFEEAIDLGVATASRGTQPANPPDTADPAHVATWRPQAPGEGGCPPS
jgi:predicted ATPase/DNA-binding SARP family transcriptional activator